MTKKIIAFLILSQIIPLSFVIVGYFIKPLQLRDIFCLYGIGVAINLLIVVSVSIFMLIEWALNQFR